MSDKCYGCEYFIQGYGGDFSLEGYAEPEPPMCQQPDLQEVAIEHEHIAVLLEGLMFQLSELNNCPFKRIKRPVRRKLKNSFRSTDLSGSE